MGGTGVWVPALTEAIVRHLTLTVPFSTQEYKWAPSTGELVNVEGNAAMD